MTTYSYIKTPVNTFAVIVTIDRRGEYTNISRPVGEYYTEKSAAAYVEKVNAHIAGGHKGPAPRFNPPLRWSFAVPDWWTKLHPNWSKGE